MALTDNQKASQKLMVLTGWYNSNPPGPAGLQMFNMGQKVTVGISNAASQLTDAQVLAQIVTYQTYMVQQAGNTIANANENITKQTNAQTVAQNNLTDAQSALNALNSPTPSP